MGGVTQRRFVIEVQCERLPDKSDQSRIRSTDQDSILRIASQTRTFVKQTLFCRPMELAIVRFNQMELTHAGQVCMKRNRPSISPTQVISSMGRLALIPAPGLGRDVKLASILLRISEILHRAIPSLRSDRGVLEVKELTFLFVR
jgi:hypothetical protein